MAFFGKTYNYDRDENFEEFLKGLDLPEETITKALGYKPSVTFLKNDDGTYTYKTDHAAFNKALTFTFNTPIDDKALDGAKVTSTFTLNGNTITQEDKFEDGRELKITREFTGDTVKQSFSTNKTNVVGIRYYKL